MANRVTICISAFNQEDFVEECVESALAQTESCDVLVVDDASTDSTPERAQRLGVPVHRLPHGGAVATFRRAVELVQTDVYCVLNADDALEPTYVAEALPHLADPRVGFVYTGWQYVGAKTGLVHARPFDARELLFGNYVLATSLARKSAYESVNGFDMRFHDCLEDWALWLAMAQRGWLGVAVDQPLVRYRRHGGPSRNSVSEWTMERIRWRMALAHPGWYGPLGFGRLAGSGVKLALEQLAGRRRS